MMFNVFMWNPCDDEGFYDDIDAENADEARRKAREKYPPRYVIDSVEQAEETPYPATK